MLFGQCWPSWELQNGVSGSALACMGAAVTASSKADMLRYTPALQIRDIALGAGRTQLPRIATHQRVWVG